MRPIELHSHYFISQVLLQQLSLGSDRRRIMLTEGIFDYVDYVIMYRAETVNLKPYK